MAKTQIDFEVWAQVAPMVIEPSGNERPAKPGETPAHWSVGIYMRNPVTGEIHPVIEAEKLDAQQADDMASVLQDEGYEIQRL